MDLRPALVLGVDSCRPGWIGILWDGTNAQARFGKTIESLIDACSDAGTPAVIAIDIPIGLADSTARKADQLARDFLPGRASSVFSTPIRTAVEAEDFATANSRNRALTGKGISKQAYALSAKILDVDRFVRDANVRIVEVHPEVTFAEMNKGALPDSKKTWAGAEQRRQLLADHGIVIPSDLGIAGRMAAGDDVLDAGAAAWTAMRVHRQTAISLPHPPEAFSDGWPAAIWR